jgi:Asp-tRNA(Asn)/Glu-tRNA(Gln) amidotransferase A subunit family amidase
MKLDELKKRVKVALRTQTSDVSLISEIDDCVDETIEDLKRAGANVNLDDPLVLKACKMNAKATFGYEQESEKYRICYQQILEQLCMYSCYSAEESNGTI